MESRIRPDWEEWSFKSYVTIEEAICLSFDLNPLLDWVNCEVPDHNYRRVEEERNPWHSLIAEIGNIPRNVAGQTIQKEWFEAATKLKAGIEKRIRMIQSAYADDQLRPNLFRPRGGAYMMGSYPLIHLNTFCNLALSRGFKPLPQQIGELAELAFQKSQFPESTTDESGKTPRSLDTLKNQESEAISEAKPKPFILYLIELKNEFPNTTAKQLRKLIVGFLTGQDRANKEKAQIHFDLWDGDIVLKGTKTPILEGTWASYNTEANKNLKNSG